MTLVIESVISYNIFIDAVGLYENYIICILKNINKNARNPGRKKKQGKIIAIAWFWMGYKICLASMGHILMAARVVRETIFLIPLNIVFNNEHICMM